MNDKEYDLLRKNLLHCQLCARRCGVDRTKGELGFCKATEELVCARASLHYWEEPPICADKGSGTVFFSNCSLKCCFCQNYNISSGALGKVITPMRLTDIFFELKEAGAVNINLVTPTHYTVPIIRAVCEAKDRGLDLPVIWNTSSYESVETLDLIKKYKAADIFLADAKFYSPEYSLKYINSENYFSVCFENLKRMVDYTGECIFDENDMLVRGTIIRILIMPNLTQDSENLIKILYEEFGNSVYFSLMSQYTPYGLVSNENFPELNRKLTQEEYDEVVDFALDIGVENGFIQVGESACESFIPEFDLRGI